MHQIASQHISIAKNFRGACPRTPLESSRPSATWTDFSPKRKILDRTLKGHCFYVDEEVSDIFDILLNTAPEGRSVIDKAIDVLTAYFKLKKNIAYKE